MRHTRYISRTCRRRIRAAASLLEFQAKATAFGAFGEALSAWGGALGVWLDLNRPERVDH